MADLIIKTELNKGNKGKPDINNVERKQPSRQTLMQPLKQQRLPGGQNELT